MQCTPEIGEYRGGIPLEHIQQHDIYHGFDQNIRTLGAYVRKALHEARIIRFSITRNFRSKKSAKRIKLPE